MGLFLLFFTKGILYSGFSMYCGRIKNRNTYIFLLDQKRNFCTPQYNTFCTAFFQEAVDNVDEVIPGFPIYFFGTL